MMTKSWQRLIPVLLIALPVQASDWQLKYLPWGAPDLQGAWTTATVSLLERPSEYENLVLTEAQTIEVERGTEAMLEEIDQLEEGDLGSGSDVGGYNAAWLDPGSRVVRVNGAPHSSIIVSPDDGQVPYTFTSRLRKYWNMYKLWQRDNPEEQDLGVRCMVGFGSSGGPPMLPVLYNNNYQFVQSPGQVLILVEMNHNIRTIRIDGTPLPASIRPWLGDSIGHWEGPTLVVRTTQFHRQQNMRMAIKHQFMMSPDSVVVERFTRVGEKEIQYEFTVEDEEIYTSVWRGQLPMYATQGPIYEYACHEGNYSISNILSGARTEERE
ncbi:MAG: hypothetical protein V7709_18030 [Halioglobus sp.]